jgi:hypothetical protein
VTTGIEARLRRSGRRLLASALLALASFGAGAITSKIANRMTSLLKRYGLPDRRKNNNGGSGDNINRDGNEEKWDTKPKPGKEKEKTTKGKGGKKPNNKGKGKNNSGSGGKDNGNKPKNTGTPNTKGPKSAGPGRVCHAFTSSSTASVTTETVSGLISVP